MSNAVWDLVHDIQTLPEFDSLKQEILAISDHNIALGVALLPIKEERKEIFTDHITKTVEVFEDKVLFQKTR